MSAIQRVGGVSLSDLASSPRQIAEGHLWLLLSSGIIAANPLVVSLVSFAALALITLAVCGSGILWFAAVVGHACSTVLAYSLVGAVRLVDPGALQSLLSAPDYGVSAICAAWLGAIATVAWRGRADSARKAAIVLGCVAAAALAWLVRGGGLDVLDTQHVLAFVVGIVFASGRVLPHRGHARAGERRRSGAVHVER